MPKEFELDVILKEGDIGISNGYEYPNYPGVWDSLIEGCAMYMEEIAPNHQIFHCNDYYNDDDLNDFVFSMEINKLEEKQVDEDFTVIVKIAQRSVDGSRKGIPKTEQRVGIAALIFIQGIKKAIVRSTTTEIIVKERIEIVLF